MEVRIAASTSDFEAFRTLADEYEASLPEELRHAAWAAERVSLNAAYGPPHAVFLAVEDGRAIGCVVMSARDDGTMIVKKLYVTPSARTGGTGRALMQALIDEAHERKSARILLDTHAEQLPAAYKLYQKLGFRERDAYEPVDYGCATFMELAL